MKSKPSRSRRGSDDGSVKHPHQHAGEAAEAKASVSDVRTAIQPIVEKETEDESPSVEAKALADHGQPPTDDMKLLRVLTGGRWPLRSMSGLAKDTGIDPATITGLLGSQVAQGLVGISTTRNGPRWFITDAGRKRLTGTA